jgi:hypothetical protein
MQLVELEACFYRIVTPEKLYIEVATIDEAQGVRFLCPKCWATNGGPVGTHSVLCWFLHRGVLDTEKPGPGRWEPHGTGLHDLTLCAASSSIALQAGCMWHGFVQNGSTSDA